MSHLFCLYHFHSVDELGKFWKSSKVVNRINNRLVETVTGQRYKLVGCMSEDEALDHGNVTPLALKLNIQWL